jgi:UDP-N-acetylglucosamine 2-epimerase (non-hydrolysing)
MDILMIACVLGTRPEVIKMAPVVFELRKRNLHVEIVTSGQHTDLLDKALEDFGLKFDSRISIPSQLRTLPEMQFFLSREFSEYFADKGPNLVLVHGDTITAAVAALSANLHHIPVGHIEAGLRSNNLHEPWPEEMNRRIIDVVARLHFCPTEASLESIQKEGLINDCSIVVGNTIVDAFRQMQEQISSDDTRLQIDPKPYVLLTQHRRESFGLKIEQLFQKISEIPALFGLDVIFPMHPNPNVVEACEKILKGKSGISIIEPCGYKELISLMLNSVFVVTDSGGIQEEAPLAGKRVLVTRNVTERPEVIESGYATLVGTSGEFLFSSITDVLNEIKEKKTLPPFTLLGDGNAAKRIVTKLEDFLGNY